MKANDSPAAEIFKLTAELRAFISQSRWHQKLLRSPDWGPVATGLDWLTYMQETIDSYANLKPSNDRGFTYLTLMGLLQACVVQQDAALELARAVDFDPDKAEYHDLMGIRNVRIAVAGHPTRVKGSGGEPDASNFVIEVTLGPGQFDLITVAGDDTKSSSVSVDGLIHDQRRGMVRFLKELLEFMEEQDRLHKEQFQGRSFEAIFTDDMDYHFQKVILGATSPERSGDWHMARRGIRRLREMLDSFGSELEERGLNKDTYSGVAVALTDVSYPIKQLLCYYLDECEGERPDSETARIFGEYLSRRFEDLKGMAREIDQEYETG